MCCHINLYVNCTNTLLFAYYSPIIITKNKLLLDYWVWPQIWYVLLEFATFDVATGFCLSPY